MFIHTPPRKQGKTPAEVVCDFYRDGSDAEKEAARVACLEVFEVSVV